MPLPVIDYCWRVTLNFTGSSLRDVHNVLHFERVGGTAADVATDIGGSFNANMWKCLHAGYVMDTFDVLPLDGVSASTTFSTGGGSSFTGGGGSSGVTPAQSGIVTLYTAERGRSRRGRVYVGPCDEATSGGAVLNAGVNTNMQTGWTDFLDDVFATPSTWVVASYKLGDYQQITSVNAQRTLATQRRRQTAYRT